MKALLIGHEFSEGVSKKTGKPYEIARLFATVKLDPQNPNAKGSMGAEYSTTAEVIKSISHNPLPLEVDMDVEEFMRYGEKRSMVVAVRPLNRVAAVPNSGTARAAA